MPRLSSLSEVRATVVADASVTINLCASGVGDAILAALPFQVVMAPEAIAEITEDRRTGRADCLSLRRYLEAGLIERVVLDDEAHQIFADLVIGAAADTLDDGEAATIALGISQGKTVAIDEAKANSLCEKRFPDLGRIASSDLFMAQSVVTALGREAHGAALFDALRFARMRVDKLHLDEVTRVLGTTRAAECLSLPRTYRQRG
jgi:predicted nucleic acid-binding protein